MKYSIIACIRPISNGCCMASMRRKKHRSFFRITELVRRTSALAEIANRVSDTLLLDVLFPRLMEVVTETLNADRSSLFLRDAESGELFSRVVQGNVIGEIRFPSHLGIAGSVFNAGRGEIISDAYADARCNQEFNRKSGYRTRNILCVPIRNKQDEVIGITQALNSKRPTLPPGILRLGRAHSPAFQREE